MLTSPSVKNISLALINFQKTVKPIKKEEVNPFYKSKYANLEAVLDAIKTPLVLAGLSVSQFPDGDGLTTLVIHAESGEWLQSTQKLLLAKQDPQGQGSALSYARRYSLCAVLGLITEDDDGNSAVVKESLTAPAKPATTYPGNNKCTTCGADAFEKRGEKNGKPWAGMFCQKDKKHVTWLKITSPKAEDIIPIPEQMPDDEIRVEEIPF